MKLPIVVLVPLTFTLYGKLPVYLNVDDTELYVGQPHSYKGNDTGCSVNSRNRFHRVMANELCST